MSPSATQKDLFPTLFILGGVDRWEVDRGRLELRQPLSDISSMDAELS